MKKWAILIFTAILLAGCAGDGTADKQNMLPSGFTFVNKDRLQHDNITVAIHNKTGCYYTFLNGDHGSAVGVTQMFIEKDGVSVPYCE